MCHVMELVLLFVNNYYFLQCLYEAGNCNKIRLLDLLCEALDPDLYTSKASNNVVLENDCGLPITSDRFMRRKYSTSQKGGLISQIIRKVRYKHVYI